MARIPPTRSKFVSRGDQQEREPLLRVPHGIPVEDPWQHLHPTARRILRTTEELVLEEGLAKLTIGHVVERSGVNRALIGYHFGSKAGLLAALVDSVMYQAALAAADEASGIADGTRIHRFVEGLRAIVEQQDLIRLISELLPYVFREDELRERVARVYEWYWQLNLEWMGFEKGRNDAHLRALSAVTVAVVDGLGIQVALQPSGLDLDEVFSTLESMLEAVTGPTDVTALS
jgi:AcrR family transcriptional regulator